MVQPRLSEVQFRAVVAVAAGLVALGMIRVRFCGELSLPPKIAQPPEPDVAPGDLAAAMDATPRLYQEYLRRDSEVYGVRPPATLETMAAVLERRVDTTGYVLVPDSGRAVEVGGLRLRASKRNVSGSVHPILVLSIENTTDRDLAYNIATRPSRGARVCARAPSLPYNALAVAAHRTETRTECIWRRGWKLEVQRVEVAVLPPLSYHYVSRIPATATGLDPRLARGHTPPDGRGCDLMLAAGARNALAQGTLQWIDIVDFFARHRCDTYQFPTTYRALSTRGERPLPVIAE